MMKVSVPINIISASLHVGYKYVGAAKAAAAVRTRGGGARYWKKRINDETNSKYHDTQKFNSIKLDIAEQTKSSHNIDVGVLLTSTNIEYEDSSSSSPHNTYNDDTHRNLVVVVGGGTSCPLDKVIVCENGYATSIGGILLNNNNTNNNSTIIKTTCKDACNSQCCIGANRFGTYEAACDGLTATICQDNTTCIGALSCDQANIVGSIYHGCNGMQACEMAGYNNGYIHSIIHSCVGGQYACYYAAAGGGFIHSIINSCQANNYACRGMAAQSGYIYSLVDSCNGGDREELSSSEFVCEDMARHSGHIISVIRSCNVGTGACVRGARSRGHINTINNSCNEGRFACEWIASTDGYINLIKDSCNRGGSACVRAAGDGGSISSIIGSCNNGTNSCRVVAYKGGIDGGIYNGCNNYRSCIAAGAISSFFGGIGRITSAINNCCNAVEECKEVNEDTLPTACRNVSSPPTASPITMSVTPGPAYESVTPTPSKSTPPEPSTTSPTNKSPCANETTPLPTACKLMAFADEITSSFPEDPMTQSNSDAWLEDRTINTAENRMRPKISVVVVLVGILYVMWC